jgi:hypothetical protein
MKTIDGGIYNESTGKVDYGGKQPKKQNMQTEMGKISNLITDMTIKGAAANSDELARAVRHSMVIIDAEKHHLNYKQSYLDNGIASLKEKYQGGAQKGASTIVSQASSEFRVDERKNRVDIDPRTGEKLYTLTGASYVKLRDTGLVNPDTGKPIKEPVINKKTGEPVVITKQTVTTKMAVATDAHTLSSGTRMEGIYADHANKLKALGNTARKEAVSLKTIPYSPSAKTTYQNEVNSLKASLNVAQKNSPKEREAQIIARTIINKKKQDNPGMTKDEETKISGQALAEARVRAGANKKEAMVKISQKEWDAIQAGAISNSMLSQILDNTDLAKVKEYATPRERAVAMPASKLARARSMLSSGFTYAEIANQLGVSVSKLTDELYK